MGHGFVRVKPSLCLSGMIPLLSHFLYSLTFICDSAFLASKTKPILSLIQMNTAAKPSNALGPRSQSQEMGTLPARSPAAANHLPEGGLTPPPPPQGAGGVTECTICHLRTGSLLLRAHKQLSHKDTYL